VTCGSVVKLQHALTKHYLHSHEVAYGSGSGQQSVTAFPDSDDANSYWTIRPAVGKGCQQGQHIKNGDVIRLQHLSTKKWLHSHLHQSPLSGNQEVSGYGSQGQSDTGDNWILETDKGSEWKKDGKVRFLHVDTGSYLGSHDMKFGRPIAGQQEVVAFRGGSKKKSSSEVMWTAGLGVYFELQN